MTTITNIPNTFQAPNFHVDRVMQYLTGNEFKVLMVAVRETLGWKDHRADRKNTISLTHFQKRTGMTRQAVSNVLTALVEFGLLIKEGEPTTKGQGWVMPLEVDMDKLIARHEENKLKRQKQTKKARKTALENRDEVVEDGLSNNTSGLSNNTSTVEQTTGLSNSDKGGLSNNTHINPSLLNQDISPDGGASEKAVEIASPDVEVKAPSNWQSLWGATKEAFRFPEGVSSKRIGEFTKFLIGNPKGDLKGEWKDYAIEPAMDADEILAFGQWFYGNHPDKFKIRKAGTVNEYVAEFRTLNNTEEDQYDLIFSKHITIDPDEAITAPRWENIS